MAQMSPRKFRPFPSPGNQTSTRWSRKRHIRLRLHLGQKGLNRTGELLEMKDERETKLKTNGHSFSYTMEGRIKRKTIFLFMHFPMIDLTAASQLTSYCNNISPSLHDSVFRASRVKVYSSESRSQTRTRIGLGVG